MSCPLSPLTGLIPFFVTTTHGCRRGLFPFAPPALPLRQFWTAVRNWDECMDASTTGGVLPHVPGAQRLQRIKSFTPTDAALTQRDKGRIQHGVEKQRKHERHKDRGARRPAQSSREHCVRHNYPARRKHSGESGLGSRNRTGLAAESLWASRLRTCRSPLKHAQWRGHNHLTHSLSAGLDSGGICAFRFERQLILIG